MQGEAAFGFIQHEIAGSSARNQFCGRRIGEGFARYVAGAGARSEADKTRFGLECTAYLLERFVTSKRDDRVERSQVACVLFGGPRFGPRCVPEILVFIIERFKESRDERVFAVFHQHVAFGAECEYRGRQRDADGRAAGYNAHIADWMRPSVGTAFARHELVENVESA